MTPPSDMDVSLDTLTYDHQDDNPVLQAPVDRPRQKAQTLLQWAQAVEDASTKRRQHKAAIHYCHSGATTKDYTINRNNLNQLAQELQQQADAVAALGNDSHHTGTTTTINIANTDSNNDISESENWQDARDEETKEEEEEEEELAPKMTESVQHVVSAVLQLREHASLQYQLLELKYFDLKRHVYHLEDQNRKLQWGIQQHQQPDKVGTVQEETKQPEQSRPPPKNINTTTNHDECHVQIQVLQEETYGLRKQLRDQCRECRKLIEENVQLRERIMGVSSGGGGGNSAAATEATTATTNTIASPKDRLRRFLTTPSTTSTNPIIPSSAASIPKIPDPPTRQSIIMNQPIVSATSTRVPSKNTLPGMDHSERSTRTTRSTMTYSSSTSTTSKAQVQKAFTSLMTNSSSNNNSNNNNYYYHSGNSSNDNHNNRRKSAVSFAAMAHAMKRDTKSARSSTMDASERSTRTTRSHSQRNHDQNVALLGGMFAKAATVPQQQEPEIPVQLQHLETSTKLLQQKQQEIQRLEHVAAVSSSKQTEIQPVMATIPQSPSHSSGASTCSKSRRHNLHHPSRSPRKADRVAQFMNANQSMTAKQLQKAQKGSLHGLSLPSLHKNKSTFQLTNNGRSTTTRHKHVPPTTHGMPPGHIVVTEQDMDDDLVSVGSRHSTKTRSRRRKKQPYVDDDEDAMSVSSVSSLQSLGKFLSRIQTKPKKPKNKVRSSGGSIHSQLRSDDRSVATNAW